jgi:hypothetical protein
VRWPPQSGPESSQNLEGFSVTGTTSVVSRALEPGDAGARRTPVNGWTPVVAVVAGLVLSGCGESAVTSSGDPASDPYDGPMSLRQAFGDRASVAERGGAAARALECATVAYSGGGGDYVDGGLETVQDSPADALENWLEEESVITVPDAGYRVEREDDGRVLLSYDVDGRTRAAVVVADGVRDWRDRTGWGVESWAGCDPIELPEKILDALGVEVWQDADGDPVPVTQVYSVDDWCDLSGVTVVQVGPEWRRDQRWWRDPTGQLAEGPDRYRADSELPADADPTGWQKDGRELWLVPDRSAAYLVSTEDPDVVERWPAAQELSCAG